MDNKYKKQRATERIHIRVKPDFKKQLEELADKYQVGLSEMIIAMLEDKMQEEFSQKG